MDKLRSLVMDNAFKELQEVPYIAMETYVAAWHGWRERSVSYKGWGDHATIHVLSVALKRDITLFDRQSNTKQEFKPSNALPNQPVIYILRSGNHYRQLQQNGGNAEVRLDWLVDQELFLASCAIYSMD